MSAMTFISLHSRKWHKPPSPGHNKEIKPNKKWLTILQQLGLFLRNGDAKINNFCYFSKKLFTSILRGNQYLLTFGIVHPPLPVFSRQLCQKIRIQVRIRCRHLTGANYHKTSSISRTKFQNLNVSCILMQLSSLNSLKPGVKLIMKMLLKQGRQAMLRLHVHLSYQPFYWLLRCDLY